MQPAPTKPTLLDFSDAMLRRSMLNLQPENRPPRRTVGPLRGIKNALVAGGPRVRRLPVGIGRGLRLEVDLHHHSKLYLGLYEFELNRHLRDLCKADFKCFDVGGQLGYDALVLAKLTGGPVVSFECEPAAVASMNVSFDANPHIDPRPIAEWAFVSSKSDPAKRQITLDDYAYGHKPLIPDLIKIDVEGHEVEVLAGAETILRDRRPELLVETHSKQLELACLRLLDQVGYNTTVIDQRRWLRDYRPTDHNRWIRAQHPYP